MEDSRGLSILSAFLKEKIDDKGWSKKEFAEKTGLSQSYAYELLAEKREKIPGDDTLKDISKALDFMSAREPAINRLPFPGSRLTWDFPYSSTLKLCASIITVLPELR